ncbi:hypothetical protein BDZ94DRAFT_473611 [Collybia nuda]|uniref:Uncharacterized protein n=1 Tax=Collybia nuda TaxID=64659 RepID=A0A9P5YB96_9AGAR|nr:hypothetical protein BDZ94DRAFT_473611 [Collybia nuda]
MLCGIFLPFWKILVFFSFPSLLLALSLDIPTRSSDGGMINISWKVDSSRDPNTAEVRVICGVKPITNYKRIQTFDSGQVSFLTDPRVTFGIYTRDCHAIAYDSS